MGLFFRKKEEIEPELMPIVPLEDLFNNIELLKEQFLAVRNEVEVRDKKIAELEEAINVELGIKTDQANEIVRLENKVAQLEELLGEIDKLIDKK